MLWHRCPEYQRIPRDTCNDPHRRLADCNRYRFAQFNQDLAIKHRAQSAGKRNRLPAFLHLNFDGPGSIFEPGGGNSGQNMLLRHEEQEKHRDDGKHGAGQQ